jgi:hypothetical protein
VRASSHKSILRPDPAPPIRRRPRLLPGQVTTTLEINPASIVSDVTSALRRTYCQRALQGRPPRAQHTTRMIFAGSLGRSCVVRTVRASSPRKANTRTEVQPEDHQCSGPESLAEDAVLYVYSANVPQVRQVHQSCVRTDLSTVRQPEVRGEISPTKVAIETPSQ